MAEIYKVDASFDHGFFKGTSCAFGVFDGVHRGHRYLLDCARSTAAETGGASVALTFDIDPDEVFHPTRLKKLMTNEERVRMLADSGVDVVAVLPFTRDFAASSPEEFLVQTSSSARGRRVRCAISTRGRPWAAPACRRTT